MYTMNAMFTSRLCWTMTQKTLASQASKAVGFIKLVSYKCGGLPAKTLFDLFDKMVLPILMYSCEIWGYNAHECINKVQTSFCKYVLGVSRSTPNAAALGECGRFPISALCKIRVVKYWLRVLLMDEGRLPKATYNMMKDLDASGRTTWASHIRSLLNMYGFSYAWENQNNLVPELLLSEFSQRVKDCSIQEWNGDLDTNGRLTRYKIFKSSLECEIYLNIVNGVCFKSALARFRCSSHCLEIETSRRQGIVRGGKFL
jgi:hypothetical protein